MRSLLSISILAVIGALATAGGGDKKRPNEKEMLVFLRQKAGFHNAWDLDWSTGKTPPPDSVMTLKKTVPLKVFEKRFGKPTKIKKPALELITSQIPRYGSLMHYGRIVLWVYRDEIQQIGRYFPLQISWAKAVPKPVPPSKIPQIKYKVAKGVKLKELYCTGKLYYMVGKKTTVRTVRVLRPIPIQNAERMIDLSKRQSKTGIAPLDAIFLTFGQSPTGIGKLEIAFFDSASKKPPPRRLSRWLSVPLNFDKK